VSKRRSLKQKQATRRFLQRASFNSAQNRRLHTILKNGRPELTYALLSLVLPGFGQYFQKRYIVGTIFLSLWLMCLPTYLIGLGGFLTSLLGLSAFTELLVASAANRHSSGREKLKQSGTGNRPEQSNEIWDAWIEESRRNLGSIESEQIHTGGGSQPEQSDEIWDAWIEESRREN
jgi:hypothetical protein